MTPSQRTHASKFLSLVLRHQPEVIGLRLEPEGWVKVDVLLGALHQHQRPWSREDLEELVRTSDKQRFAFDAERTRIRAQQGHSVAVNLDHPVRNPPEFLYHGTAAQFVDSIRREGLRRGERHHVHLSAETEITLRVGARRGKPVLLTIRAGDMQRAGFTFCLTPNHVWLTDHVPPQYLKFPDLH